MTLKLAIRSALQAGYEKGLTATYCAALCHVSGVTASQYYKRFAEAGIPRGAIRRKNAAHPRELAHPKARGLGWPAPYTGPDWIGKPAS